MNILIPIAGKGQLFRDAGFGFPKSLVEVLKKPMIQLVIENLSVLDGRFIFICNEEDVHSFNLDVMLRTLTTDCRIIIQKGQAKGAACSTLMAVDHIDDDEELIVAGGDQYLTVDLMQIITAFRDAEADGGIITFNAVHPQFSFAKVDEDGWVVEVAEKKPISDLATAGVYWYRRGADYIAAVKEMIQKEDTFNELFYICPAFNQMILSHKRILNRQIDEHDFITFGTPARVNQINATGSLSTT